jgi:hypothetical protein
MWYRIGAVCAAVLTLATGAGAQPRPQPDPPLKELPPAAGDPFTDPIFSPPAGPKATPPPPGATLYDAATANDPLAIPPTGDCLPQRAVEACACGPGYTTWLTAEWLIGRTRGASLVPVVTTGPVGAGVLAGAVGQPATVPLFGGRPVLNDWRSGLRVEAGVWLDDDHRTGVSARVYSLFSAREQFAAAGAPGVVNLPQFTPAGPVTVQTPVFASFPGVTTGGATAFARTSFTGGDLNLRRLLTAGPAGRVELLAGYRQLHLGDELGDAFNVTPAVPVPLVAARQFGFDDVRTRNDFFGPQLGLFASTGGSRLTLEAHTALALGVTVSDLDFARARVVAASPTGGPVATAAELVALGVPRATAIALTPALLSAANAQVPLTQAATSNTLTYFGVVGEGGLRLNWRATDHLRLTAGYSFVYWNNVRRAEEMFLTSPVLRPRAIDFTTHLFSVGLDLRF